MLTPDQFNEVLKQIVSLKLLDALRPLSVTDGEGRRGLRGERMVQGHTVTLRLELDDDFPVTLPHFLLEPPDALGFIPHVDQRGVICYADDEGMVYDRNRPLEIIREALELAEQVLAKGISEQNAGDFADEFEVHWNNQSRVIRVCSVLNPGDLTSQITLARDKRTKEVKFVGSEKEIRRFSGIPNFTNSLNFEPILYVPLKEGTKLIPPPPDHSFWTPSQIRSHIFPAVSPENVALAKLLLKNSKISNEYIVFKLPRPSGGASLFGLRYEGTNSTHPFIENGFAQRVYPVLPVRLEQNYLVQRGGAYKALDAKRVLVVGCGAVGGHVVSQLAHAGILRLTLVDPDFLLPENTFRHLLGRDYWNTEKVVALKRHLGGQLPYTNITAFPVTIQEVMARKKIRLDNYDLIVVAIGKPPVELEFNSRIQKLENAPPTIFTWLEPLGIGGHALLTNHPAGNGCFECLYTATEGQESKAIVANRAAFASPNQIFGRALSGCGSLHTPYAAFDAEKTALLASRLAVDTLNGRTTGNPLLSWKGEKDTFEEQGFTLSNRFNCSENSLWKQRYAYQSPYCRVCEPKTRKP